MTLSKQYNTLFLFETLNRVGWLLYCSICAAQLFRLLRTKCRFIKQVSHSCIASPPESLRHISPSPPPCHSWTFTRWCSSLAGPGVPQAQARPSLHSVITYIHSPLFSCPLGTWPIFSGHNIHMNVLPSSSCLLDLKWCFIWHWQKRAMSCLVCLFRPTPSKVNKSKKGTKQWNISWTWKSKLTSTRHLTDTQGWVARTCL